MVLLVINGDDASSSFEDFSAGTQLPMAVDVYLFLKVIARSRLLRYKL